MIPQGTAMVCKSPHPSRIGDPHASTSSSVMVTAGRQANHDIAYCTLQHASPASDAQTRAGNSAPGSLMTRRAD